MSSVKIGVLISGGGTNLQALIDSVKAKYINGEIVVVISNREKAYGLQRANKSGIESVYIDKKKFDNDLEYNREIMKEFKKRDVELVVLAGYLKILSDEFVNEYENRMINIHPSLIPSFCGDGFYGERIHKAALDYGVKITGATVHFVESETDTGPIILQESVKVDDNETVESLQKKVLAVEHEILVEAVKLYCEGRLEVMGRKVIVKY